MDWPDVGKNYLVIVKEFKQLIDVNNATTERVVESILMPAKSDTVSYCHDTLTSHNLDRGNDYFEKYCDKKGDVNADWSFWYSGLKGRSGF